METMYDIELGHAISKYSSTGIHHLKLNLTEQILVSTLLNISSDYPNMETDPQYQETLEYVKSMKI